MNKNNSPISLYVHLPWCIQKCPYCDFNSHGLHGEKAPTAGYIQSLLEDLQNDNELLEDRSIQSIFFGGGTPSLFTALELNIFLEYLRNNFNVASNCEITIEANPGAIDDVQIQLYPDVGINRISCGIQSFNDNHLKTLGRIHNKDDIIKTLELIQQANYKSFNIDIMYGLPSQTVDEAISDLQEALSFSPPHLSWYQLTIEPNTVFYKTRPALPVDDKIISMEENGVKLLNKHGLERYEISAYSKSSHFCYHNLNYWRYGDYLGIGAGAHSKITKDNSISRSAKVRQPNLYMQKLNKAVNKIEVQNEERIFEFMLNNMRLLDSIPLQRFTETTFLPLDLIQDKLINLHERELIRLDDTSFKMTDTGIRYLNEITEEFLP